MNMKRHTTLDFLTGCLTPAAAFFGRTKKTAPAAPALPLGLPVSLVPRAPDMGPECAAWMDARERAYVMLSAEVAKLREDLRLAHLRARNREAWLRSRIERLEAAGSRH